MVMVLGVVMMIAEMAFGQRAQQNSVESFKVINPRWAFVGLLGVICALIISCFYSVIGGWTLFAAGNSFNSNELTNNVNGFFDFASSGFLPILLAGVFLFASIAIISLGVVKGIERFSKIVMPILFVLLIIVMIRSLTLGEGVADGLYFMFHVDFSELGLEGVLAAMGQAFYSLSIGVGVLLTYGSYTKKEVNLVKSTFIIVILDTVLAIIVGLAIFPAVFAFGLSADSGVALMFETLPQVFAQMGGIGMLFSFIFFLLVFIAAITSLISIIETGTAFFIDRFNINKKKILIAIGVFLLSIASLISLSVGSSMNGEPILSVFGKDLLTLFDDLTSKTFMPICSLLFCLCINISLKPETMLKEIRENGHAFKFGEVWVFIMKYITPLLISVVLVVGIIELVTTPYGIFVVVLSLGVVGGVAIANQVIVSKQNKKSKLGLDKN